MNNRKVQIVIGVVFLVVAVVAVVNTYQLNSYIRTTLQRDSAQEECQRDTLIALRGWAQSRLSVEAAYDHRDEANQVLFEDLAAGKSITPDHAKAVLDAIAGARTARAALQRNAAENPIPTCRIG